MPVIAANRIGEERVEPCAANGGQSSALVFYGSSFIADQTGEIVAGLGREEEGVITASFDLDEVREDRMSWGALSGQTAGDVWGDMRVEGYRLVC